MPSDPASSSSSDGPGAKAEQAPAPVDVGDQTARGFVWVLLEVLGTRVVSAGSQVALAWLLLPEHFGLVGLAQSVMALTTALSLGGVQTVLVQRHGRFRELSSAAFWLCLGSGGAAAALTAAAAPAAASIYREPELFKLLLALALAIPIRSFGLVAEAWLRIGLKFRVLTILALVNTVLVALLSVLFAWLGFGALSFVLPQPIVAVVRSIGTWSLARPPMEWKRGIKGWKKLLPDGGRVLGWSLLTRLMAQADYFVLGVWHDAATVGLYFFAFSLAMQARQLLLSSVARVLFPALSHLTAEPDRQLSAFLRASRVLAFVAVPVYVLQLVVAVPLFEIFFADRWRAAIVLFQILSASVVLRVVTGVAVSMLNAQGRFGTLLAFRAIGAPVLFSMYAYAAWQGGPVDVAWAAVIWSIAPGPVLVYLALRPTRSWHDVLRVYLIPVLTAAAAGGLAWGASAFVPQGMRGGYWLQLVVAVLVMTAGYVGLTRNLVPDLWRELQSRFRRLANRARSQHPGRDAPAI